MRYNTLTRMATSDDVQVHLKNVCAQNGYTATFMPKPMFRDTARDARAHEPVERHHNLFFDKKAYALFPTPALVYRRAESTRGGAARLRGFPTNSYRRWCRAMKPTDQPRS